MEARANAAAPAGTSSTLFVPWTIHDLRRTFATGLQHLGIRLEATEAVLNHISGSWPASQRIQREAPPSIRL
jgi:hypothetical protein